MTASSASSSSCTTCQMLDTTHVHQDEDADLRSYDRSAVKVTIVTCYRWTVVGEVAAAAVAVDAVVWRGPYGRRRLTKTRCSSRSRWS